MFLFLILEFRLLYCVLSVESGTTLKKLQVKSIFYCNGVMGQLNLEAFLNAILMCLGCIIDEML